MMDANWPFSEREHASSAISALGQKLDEARAERDRLARELEQTREVIACAQQTIEMHMRARQHYEAQLARMQPVVEAATEYRDEFCADCGDGGCEATDCKLAREVDVYRAGAGKGGK